MIWALSPDHFALAWATTGHDTFPPPLRVQPTARTVQERHAQQVALTDWWHHTPTRSDFETALGVLADPSVRIEVFAVVDTPVRVLGVANAHTAVVVTQDAGPDPAVGGTIHLRSVRRAYLAGAVVEALPARRPGTEPAATAAAIGLRPSPPTSVMYDPFHIPDAQRMRRLLAAPREGTGHLLVTVDGEHPPRVLSWIDPVDDGRYLVRSGVDVECVPATTEEFVTRLNLLIAGTADRTSDRTGRRITPM